MLREQPASMSDESQFLVPESFIALHSTPRGRLTLPRDELRQRYELCEDLAQQLMPQGQRLHHDLGLAQSDVVERCHAGLCTPESGLTPPEAGWVVTRLAELLGWPWQGEIMLGVPALPRL
jgi:hypothetical protein